jgi:hypothetical protein
MEMGLYNGTGALDLQAKSLAAYEVILDQTKDAQGDFARTSDGLAGQQKILTAQLENLKTTFGENLLPVMRRVVEQANFVAKAFGGKDPESLSERARELAGTYDGQGSGGYNLGLALRNLADAFSQLFGAINNNDDADGTLNKLASALISVANAINAIAGAYSAAKEALSYLGGSGSYGTFGGLKGLPNPFSRAAGGSVMGGQAYRVGEFGSEIICTKWFRVNTSRQGRRR